jgi:hypothetical protein
MNRRERRAQDPQVQEKKEKHTQASVLGDLVSGVGAPVGKGNSGGWGVGSPTAKPAGGQQPTVNPFIIPKAAGLTITSQTFPSNYYVEWTLSTWRAACDQAIKMGYTMAYATLTSWVFESSPFVQSLFRALESPIGKVPLLAVNRKGVEYTDWTEELCNKAWQIEMRKKIAVHSHMFGFIGLNQDPVNGKIYKYPGQDIDPINRMLRSNTYSFYDGISFDETANLLFAQPSTSYESFLGWMQPISRSFIQMNLTKNNWIGAGRRLAFPLMTVGYPQADSAIDPATGLDLNPYKIQAENIAANVDPTKATVYPYTIDEKGNIVKSIQVDFEKPGTGAKAHDIFKDFNDSEKDEIREMILGGTLTSNVGSSGSRALGQVHEDKLETVISDLIDFTVTYLNDEWLPKIKLFYKNFPDDLRLQANKAKQLSVDDIEKLATVLQMSGKRLTDNFFVANGLSKDFFEDAPIAGTSKGAVEDNTEFAAVIPSRSLLSKKKS